MEEKGNNDVLEEKDNDDVSEENDNDDALPVSNVEINIGEENEMIAHQFYQESNCCNILGFRGIFIFALTIVVTVFQYAILLTFSRTYSGTIQGLSRPGVWLFVVLSALFTILLLWELTQWKRIANYMFKRNQNQNNSNSGSSANFAANLIQFYRGNLGVNGKYYFWKLYIFEAMENVVYFFNLRQVYLCTLSFEVVAIVYIVLIGESIFRVFVFSKTLWFSLTDAINVDSRDTQITVDIFVDLFSLIFPLAMIQTYKVKLIFSEIFWILVPPSLSLFGKLRCILTQSIALGVDQIIASKQKRVSRKHLRRVKSLFEEARQVKIKDEQNRYFPRWAKLTVLSSSVLFCALVIVTFLIELGGLHRVDEKCASMLGADTDFIWHQGCLVKTPFCQDIFAPTCDCAAIEIKKHNATTLTNGIADLTNLRRISIQNGPLKRLPTGMEKLRKMTFLDFKFNALEKFNVDISNFNKLNKLYLDFNKISSVHSSVWNHETLTQLWLNSNIGMKFPDDPAKIYLPNVYFFDVRNNSVALPSTFGEKQVPNILFLYLNRNDLPNGKFPKSFETLSVTLIEIGVAETKLESLPNYLETFHNLRYLDARENNLTSIPKGFGRLVEEKKIEFLASENEVLCKAEHKYCKPLCSKYCYSVNHKGNNYCDEACNSEACQYDGGDCRAGPGA